MKPPRKVKPIAENMASKYLEMSLRVVEVAMLTTGPVRLEVDELPKSWMLRKYVCTVCGVAQESSLPPKNVLESCTISMLLYHTMMKTDEKYSPPMLMRSLVRSCIVC